jgi:ERCC4-related helicase
MIQHKLRMISSGYLPYKDMDNRDCFHDFAENPKIEWLKAALNAVPDVRAIFFHVYTHTGELLCRLLAQEKISHAWLHGGISSSAQDKAVYNFQQGHAQILVLNAASGNAGLDFKVADWQCYVESPTSAIQRQQSEGRALGMRDGRQLLMDDLICSKIEQKVLDYVAEGRDLLYEFIFNPRELL